MGTKITASYAGARVTRLVNRDDILDRIETAIRDPSGRTHVFYIEAPGGTGKTFLAREVLRRCREGGRWAAPDLLAARNEIDLYHHQTHSREGFMETFVEALGVGPDHFATYQEQYRRLQEVKYHLRGAVSMLGEHQVLLAQRFLEGCEELATQKRIVMVLDTVEKLVYETDRVQRALGLSEAAFSVRPWLLGEWLPRMRNAVILICGRPRKQFAADLTTAMETHKIQFEATSLGNFAKDDTMAYFKALQQTAERDDNDQALRRLKAISPERRWVIHHLTDGHPITLALMIDYYLVTGRLLPEVKSPLEEVQALTGEELEGIRERIKADVVRQFREIGRPADEAIIALAWAPKGMDAELLSRVAGMELQEASEILEVLAHSTKGLSFVKIRPADKHAFLHDEMYALMKEYVLDKLPEARAEQVHREILGYYAEEIRAQKKEIRRLRTQQWEQAMPDGRVVLAAAPGAPADPRALANALASLDDLEVEELYYRLQQDPPSGFEAYCEYAEAAVTANDNSQDMRLRDEMLTFVREAFGEKDEVQGLRRGDVERNAAIRWAWRFIYAGRPEKADEIIEYLRAEMAEFLDEGGPLAWAELDVANGWAAAFLGSDLRAKEALLRDAIQTLSRLQPGSGFEQWRRTVTLAKAYNALGYMLRVEGRFHSACEAYRCALPFWRGLELEVNHADTLNNLAWANAEAGDFGRALRRCHDGLELREALGYRYLIALSYNTLGLIEIKADQPHRGRVHCERALAIFRELGVLRGVGLACTGLAEAHRRCAETPSVYFPVEKVEQLRLAKEFATQAVQIFREEVLERLRLVEALNELGCVYRNWARVWPEYHDEQDPDLDELVGCGADALKEAARIAADVFPYRQVDALVNLAWLYFYIDEPEQALDTLCQAEEIVAPEYFFARKEGRPQIQDPLAFFWVQLGKSRLLRGEIALRRYQQLPQQRDEVRDAALWREVAEHFTLALAYYELFAEDFRDMRRAKDTMYEALRKIIMKELRALYEGVDATAQEYQLERRPGRNGQPARPRMRNFLEEYFGTLEELEEGPVCRQS